MSSQRTSLGLDLEKNEQIDIAELIESPQTRPAITPEIKKALIKEGEKHGFVSRESRKIGRRR